MFTGIVEALGAVDAVTADTASSRIVIVDPVVADSSTGDSIAVNGVCLTATRVDGDRFTADVMAETLRRTTLGALRPGDPVNIERAVTPATRLGGHLVQGHVDGVGTVTGRAPYDDFDEVSIELPAELMAYVVAKGSIAVDGVSLTVAAVGGRTVTIGLIPETLQRTTLGRRLVGDHVNIEVDVIAKYVERLIESRLDRLADSQAERR